MVSHSSEIQFETKGKSLKDIVEVVEKGCDAKLNIFSVHGFFTRIWNVFLRFLVRCGFKSYTPQIDKIHQIATEIRAAENFKLYSELSPTGHSLFFFKKQVEVIIDFFKELSEGQRAVFGVLEQHLDKNNLSTIPACIDRAEALQTCFETYETEYDKINPHHTVSAAGKAYECPLFGKEKLRIIWEFDDIFYIVARGAYLENDLPKAAEALSKVKYIPGRDAAAAKFVSDLIDGCLEKQDTANALLALKKVFLIKWKEQLKVGLAILNSPTVTEEGIKTVFGLAEQVRYEDQESILVNLIIEKCLKEKRYYNLAVEAVEFYYFDSPRGGRRHHEMHKALEKIAYACLEQGDLAIAKQAHDKMQSDKTPVALREKLAEAFVAKKDYTTAGRIAVKIGCDVIQDRPRANYWMYRIAQEYVALSNFKDAAEVFRFMFRSAILPEYCKFARHVFSSCFQAKDYSSAISAANFIYSEEETSKTLLQIANNCLNNKDFDTARSALFFATHGKCKEEHEKLSKQLQQQSAGPATK